MAIVTRKDVKIADFIIETANVLPNYSDDPRDRRNRNFSGFAQGAWNSTQKYFTLQLDEDLAEAMANDEWNVRKWENKEDPTIPPKYYLQVKVDFSKAWALPDIQIMDHGVVTRLDEESIPVLDNTNIGEARVKIRARPWLNEDTGAVGVTAYCSELWVKAAQNDNRDKWFGVQQEEEALPFN